MNEEYSRWNEALAAFLLRPRPGKPLFLYVDRGVLADAFGLLDEEEALERFTSAVRARCLGAQPFSWARSELRAWRLRGAHEPPPFLAVLCLTVLAAAERTTSHFQYYEDLNRLLGRPLTGKMPAGFDLDVPHLFRSFNWWLRLHPEMGTPTADEHPRWSYIGWPVSQALLRPADSRELLVLMRRAGIQPGQTMGGGDLLRRVLPLICLMGESPCRTRLMDASEQFPDLLQQVLERELVAWGDGDRDEVALSSRVDLRLAHEEEYGDWWLVGRRPAGATLKSINIDGLELSVAGRGVIAIEHPDPFALLGRGLVGRAVDSITVRAPGRGAKWMRVDRDAGGWLEQPLSDPSEEQLRLVPCDDSEATAWSNTAASRVDTAPGGWCLWRVPAGTVLDDETPERPRRAVGLEGGLLLRPTTRTYLRSQNGAPDVTLAEGADASVDGMPLAVQGGRALLPALETGQHVITSPSGELKFRVLDRVRTHLSTEPETAWTRRGEGLRLGAVEQGQPVVWGAWVDDTTRSAKPDTRVPFSARLVWVIGPNGELAKREVRPLAWIAPLGLAATETDVRRGLDGLDFEPTYAIAFRTSSSRAHVVQVTAQRAARPRDRDVTSLERQQLVQRLLHSGTQPLSDHDDRRWKRALALLLRGGGR